MRPAPAPRRAVASLGSGRDVGGHRYRRVADALEARIGAEEFPVGALLPGELALAREYDVARGTVRAALGLLGRRGLVASRPGRGWVVQSPSHVQGLSGFRSFAQWATARGLAPGGQVIAATDDVPNATEARQLRVPQGDAVLRVTRLRTLDGRAVMVERSVYPSWVVPVVRDLPADTPSYVAAMAEAGIVEASGTHRIDAMAASGEDARLLGVRRSGPLLRVERQAFAADGRPIDLSDDRYLPGVVSLEVRARAEPLDRRRARG